MTILQRLLPARSTIVTKSGSVDLLGEGAFQVAVIFGETHGPISEWHGEAELSVQRGADIKVRVRLQNGYVGYLPESEAKLIVDGLAFLQFDDCLVFCKAKTDTVNLQARTMLDYVKPIWVTNWSVWKNPRW